MLATIGGRKAWVGVGGCGPCAGMRGGAGRSGAGECTLASCDPLLPTPLGAWALARPHWLTVRRLGVASCRVNCVGMRKDLKVTDGMSMVEELALVLIVPGVFAGRHALILQAKLLPIMNS